MIRARIINETGRAHDTRVTVVETGVDLTKLISVAGLSLNIIPNEKIMATLQLSFMAFDVQGEAKVTTRHPSGDYRPLKSMTFEDGTVVEF